jgi:ornithine cyclodeaminase
MTLLLLNEDELRQLITLPEAVETVRAALLASAEGRMETPGGFSLDLPDVKGKVQVTGVHFSQSPCFAVRVGSHYVDNPQAGLPVDNGLLAVFEAATGLPAALMVDNGYLANLRVGAAGALVAEALANPRLEHVAVLGAGPQAYYQLKALLTLRQPGVVWVWDSSPLAVDTFIRQLIEEHALDLRPAENLPAILPQADLVILTEVELPSPVWLQGCQPGAHLTIVSTEPVAAPRLEPALLRRADLIVADNPNRCREQGEMSHAPDDLRAGLQKLSDVISGRLAGRTQPEQLTVAELVGLAAHDTALAALALDKALFLGLGQRLEAGLSQKRLTAGVEGRS